MPMNEAESGSVEGSVKEKKPNRIRSLFSSSRTRNESPKGKASESSVFWISHLSLYIFREDPTEDLLRTISQKAFVGLRPSFPV